MHGEAVNVDMAFMTYVAHARGLLGAEEKEQILQCMRGLELPVWHSGCSWALIQRALRERLKHSGGQPRMPLPTGLGVAGTARGTPGGPPAGRDSLGNVPCGLQLCISSALFSRLGKAIEREDPPCVRAPELR